MDRPKSDFTPSFRQISRATVETHGETVGTMSYAYRPNDKTSNAFHTDRQPLGRFTMLAHRAQWREKADRLLRSNIVALFSFRYDRELGRVWVDARRDPGCNAAAWDIAIPRAAHQKGHHILSPDANPTGAMMSTLLYRAAVLAAESGGAVDVVPEFPEFLLAFPASAPPVPERTPTTLHAVRIANPALAAAPDDAIPDEAVRAVVEGLTVRDGAMLYVPQWLLGREVAHASWYASHPIDGTPRPEAPAADGERSGGWIMVDGCWLPAAQRPADVVADLSGVLGRETTAAWEVLVAYGLLPPMPHAEWAAGCDDAEWARFRDRTLPGFLAPGASGVASPAVHAWRICACAPHVTDDVVRRAFDDVRRPAVVARESKVGTVALQGRPRSESMTYRHAAFEANLFDVRREWERQIRPASPAFVGRAFRREREAAQASRMRAGAGGVA